MLYCGEVLLSIINVFVENKVVLCGVKTCYLAKGSVCLFVNLIVFLHRLTQLRLVVLMKVCCAKHNTHTRKTICRCVETPKKGFLDIVIITLTFNFCVFPYFYLFKLSL